MCKDEAQPLRCSMIMQAQYVQDGLVPMAVLSKLDRILVRQASLVDDWLAGSHWRASDSRRSQLEALGGGALCCCKFLSGQRRHELLWESPLWMSLQAHTLQTMSHSSSARCRASSTHGIGARSPWVLTPSCAHGMWGTPGEGTRWPGCAHRRTPSSEPS